VSDIAMPAGSPEGLEQAAAQLRQLAARAGDLAAASRRSMEGVALDADWTGKAADSYAAWTSGLASGVGQMEAPLAQLPPAVDRYAAALRTAQRKVGAYQAYASQVAQFTGPVTAAQAAQTRARAQALAADAGDSLTQLEQAGEALAWTLEKAVEGLTHAFDASGPFHHWLENLIRPVDALAGDIWEEMVISRGDKAKEAAEFVADLNKDFAEETVKILSPAARDALQSFGDLPELAAEGDLQELDNALAEWQRLRGLTEAVSNSALKGTSPLLARLLPDLKAGGGVLDAADIAGGIYNMIKPPEYDHGNLRWITRGAGMASAFDGTVGIAEKAGLVDFEDLALGAVDISWVPGVGEALGVAAGLYLAGDYIYHNTHQIAHTFDTARHAVAHVTDDLERYTDPLNW
jgi:uncharacterized protein YukE